MPTIKQAEIEQALDAWANHLLNTTVPQAVGKLAIVGLISHGDVLARRLVQKLQAAGCQAEYGALDITLYRDDLSLRGIRPALKSSYLPFSPDDMTLVLVDDVCQTGRTARAAMEVIFEYGRPAKVELHCLADRGGRQLPIQPNYAAFKLDSPDTEHVQLHLQEIDGTEELTY
jgi:pyrimidine operon attenuation protein/uracil phosphoribosyltransferase